MGPSRQQSIDTGAKNYFLFFFFFLSFLLLFIFSTWFFLVISSQTQTIGRSHTKKREDKPSSLTSILPDIKNQFFKNTNFYKAQKNRLITSKK